MAKKANQETIDRWKLAYWRQRRKSSNKEMAEKLGVDEGNLSAYGKPGAYVKGAKKPSEDYIKHFYMTYPDLESPDNKETDTNSNEKHKEYKQADYGSHSTEEPEHSYMNWDDPASVRNVLFSTYKNNNEFLRSEFSKITSIGQTAANAFDKMAESLLISNREVEFYRKQTNPDTQKPPTS